MNVDEAWESFIKSHQIKKASIDEKLDVIASQMNELQTDVSRLAENIPEMQGDAAAMETANAMAGPEMGAEPGLDELGAMMGEEGAPMPEEGAPMPEGGAPIGEEPMPEEGAPMEGEAPMEAPAEAPEAPMEAPVSEEGASMGMPPMGGEDDELTDEELDALLGGPDLGAPEMGGTSSDMIGKIKELIMNEDDPGKLAALSELLSMAANPVSAEPMMDEETDVPIEEPMEAPVEEAPAETDTEPVGKSESFEKMTAPPSDVESDTNAAEEAVDTKTEEAPVIKSYSSDDLMSRIMDAIMPILQEYTGESAGMIVEEAPMELPLDGESEPEGDAEVIIEEISEGADEDVPEKDEEEGEDSDDEGKDDEEDDDEEDKADPEDDISEETDHFEASDCIKKSFADMLSHRMESRVGVDGSFAKIPVHMRESKMTDGFSEEPPVYTPILKSSDDDVGGRHIVSYQEMMSIQKSDRPGSETSVNGDIDRPNPLTFKKSGGASASGVSFEELMNASDPHELMQKEWDEYNLFKSQY